MAGQTDPDLKHTSPTTISKTLVDEWRCIRWKSGLLRGLRFPDLAELRAIFGNKHGPQEWPATATHGAVIKRTGRVVAAESAQAPRSAATPAPFPSIAGPPHRTLCIRSPIVALLVTIAGIAHAAAPVDYGLGLIPYKTVGKWQVQYDPSVRGCAIFSSFDNGTEVRFGFNKVHNPDRYPAYIALANNRWWPQFKLYETYTLEVGFDDKPSHQLPVLELQGEVNAEARHAGLTYQACPTSGSHHKRAYYLLA